MKKYKSPIISVIFWIVIAAFFAIMIYSFWSMPKRDTYMLSQSDIEWFSQGDVPIDISDKKQILALKSDDVYTVYFYAKEYAENIVLSFRTNFSEVNVLLNDSTIYTSKNHSTYENDGLFKFKAPSSEIHLTNIKCIEEGDKISLKVKNFYDGDICGVSNIYYGRSEDISDAIFRNDLFGIFLCIVLFSLAILMFVFHFAFKKVITLNGIKYAAFFAFFAALHALSEGASLSFLLVLGNNALFIVHTLSFTVMFLPLIMFFSENVQFRASIRFLLIMAIVQATAVFGVIILSAVGAADFHESFWLVEIVGLVQCVFILAVLLYDFARKSERRSSELILPLIYAIFVIFAAMGHIFSSGNAISVLFAISCLLFLSVVLVINMRNVANTLQLSNEVAEIGKVAFTDALTGVGNTAAFHKKIKHLEVVKVNYKAIAIIQFDINNLKVINDNLGHEQGDKLITDGSGIIYKVFGKVGEVYRTGGDEFVGIICGDRAMALCDEAILSFERAIDEYNSDESHKFILQIAYGAEYYSNDGNNSYLTLKEIQKKADANMYEKKREMKTRISIDQVLKRAPLDNGLLQ